MNLVEIVWKDQIRALYPDPGDYNHYMGQVIFVMAIIASLTGLMTTTKVIQRYSWTASALISPVIVGITGIIFFHFIFFPNQGMSWVLGFLHMSSPLALSVALGSAQNCLSRASKYTFFDATKEIAFIPLSSESKLKGKAAIDGVGSRLGKSGGSVIYQGLIILFSSVAGSIPWVAALFLAVILIWVLAVVALGKRFDQLVPKAPKPKEPMTPAEKLTVL